MAELDMLTETPEEKAEIEAIRTEVAAPEVTKPAPEQAKPDPAKPEIVKPEPAKPESRLVPIHALHEARAEAKALKARLAELEKPAPKPEAQVNEIPDETVDPIGALAALRRKIAAQEEDVRSQQETARQIGELSRQVSTRVTAYAAEHPEYLEQVAFLRNSRAGELRLLGHDDESIGRQINMEEMSLGKLAVDRDLDPGEMMANLAKHRGWQPKAPDPKPGAETPTPVATEAVKAAIVESEAKINRLERGQRAARSSSGGAGGGPTPEMTLEQIAELDGAAFDAAFPKVKSLMA